MGDMAKTRQGQTGDAARTDSAAKEAALAFLEDGETYYRAEKCSCGEVWV